MASEQDILPAPDEPQKEDKIREDVVDKALNMLAEHYDAVQIFGTYQTQDKTSRYDKGRGNFYTRYGMVKSWIKREELDP